MLLLHALCLELISRKQKGVLFEITDHINFTKSLRFISGNILCLSLNSVISPKIKWSISSSWPLSPFRFHPLLLYAYSTLSGFAGFGFLIYSLHPILTSSCIQPRSHDSTLQPLLQPPPPFGLIITCASNLSSKNAFYASGRHILLCFPISLQQRIKPWKAAAPQREQGTNSAEPATTP